jgi:hypothetical protein
MSAIHTQLTDSAFEYGIEQAFCHWQRGNRYFLREVISLVHNEDTTHSINPWLSLLYNILLLLNKVPCHKMPQGRSLSGGHGVCLDKGIVHH